MRTQELSQSLLDRAFGDGPPDERLRAVAELERQLELLRKELVSSAREDGVTWAVVGEALGTSAQAAQQRYAPRRKRPASDPVVGRQGTTTERAPARTEKAPKSLPVADRQSPAGWRVHMGGMTVLRVEPDVRATGVEGAPQVRRRGFAARTRRTRRLG